MDLKAINEISLLEGNKPTKKLTELQADTPYSIIKGSIKKTKYGKAVLLELEEAVVFLPCRVTEVYAPYVKYFDEGRYCLVYKGTKAVNKPNPAVLFEIVEK